ncbi:MAG: HesA/MoeB/ThiF family protein [Candidatus Bathyarchaeia archaeon]
MPGLLSDEELEAYSRQIVLRDIGYAGQLKLKEGTVSLVGLGGLGSPIATQLTAMGVGHLRLVDRDVVERSNLQRQHLYSVDSIGYPKVEAAAERLKRLNPNVDLELLPLSVRSSNAELIVKGADVVVDGLDRMAPRYALNRAAVKAQVPYVFGAAIEMFGNVSTILPGSTACLECFLPGLNDDLLPTCAVAGVHPSIIGIVASIETAEAVRVLLGENPQLAGRLLYCDLRSLSFDMIPVSRVENCAVCGRPVEEVAPQPRWKPIEELCSRAGKRSYIVNVDVDLRLDLASICRRIRDRGLQVKIESPTGLRFVYKQGCNASLLSSGIMLVEGAADENEVAELYQQITGRNIPADGQ